MSDVSDGTFAVCVFAGVVLLICAVLVSSPSENKFMELGDEVTTTDEYTTFFNESFSGRIVSIDKSYIVRDENGNERTFKRKWIDHIDDEGEI